MLKIATRGSYLVLLPHDLDAGLCRQVAGLDPTAWSTVEATRCVAEKEPVCTASRVLMLAIERSNCVVSPPQFYRSRKGLDVA